jgi:uncharacterized protein
MKRWIETLLAAGVLAFALSGVVVARPLEDGEALDQGTVLEDAARTLRPLADQGNAKAQFYLGLMYRVGEGGLPQDYASALDWFQKSADQGYSEAQFQLGGMYAVGDGVPQDYVQAVVWWRRAADQGNALAQGSLGLAYALGQGVMTDYAQAATWYRKAADQGDAEAQLALGLLYKNGNGVLQDYISAHMWFNLAASHAADAGTGEKAARFRDGLTGTMTPAEIAEAQRMAREWAPKK